MVTLGVTLTELPTKAPGFQVIGEILEVAVKLTLAPLQIEVSFLATKVGIGITVTFTVSLFIPQALDTCAI